MATFVPSVPSLPAGRRHAISSLSCWQRQQPPVPIVPRRCRLVMTQAVSVEQQRAFDQRMNRMCNEVVRWCPPCVFRMFFSWTSEVKTILRGSAEDVVALRKRLVDSSADFVSPSAAVSPPPCAPISSNGSPAVADGTPPAVAADGASGAGVPATPTDAGVLFHSCVVALLDHTLSPAVPSLSGPYARAFEGMVRLVEDAGWQITAPVMKITG